MLEHEEGVPNDTGARVQLPQDQSQELEASAEPAKLRVGRQVAGHMRRPKEVILGRIREQLSADSARHAQPKRNKNNDIVKPQRAVPFTFNVLPCRFFVLLDAYLFMTCRLLIVDSSHTNNISIRLTHCSNAIL